VKAGKQIPCGNDSKKSKSKCSAVQAVRKMGTMELEKIRGLNDEELKAEEAKAGEQLFRIRFAKSLGKQEGAGKIKSLKLDIARIKTISKERQLETAKAGKE
jgi:large subunit ribosomal protein L29